MAPQRILYPTTVPSPYPGSSSQRCILTPRFSTTYWWNGRLVTFQMPNTSDAQFVQTGDFRPIPIPPYMSAQSYRHCGYPVQLANRQRHDGPRIAFPFPQALQNCRNFKKGPIITSRSIPRVASHRENDPISNEEDLYAYNEAHPNSCRHVTSQTAISTHTVQTIAAITSFSENSFDSGINKCPICLENIRAAIDVPNRMYSTNGRCNHAVCIDCIKGWLKQQLETRTIPIRCPVCLGGVFSHEVLCDALQGSFLKKEYLKVKKLVERGVTRPCDTVIQQDMERDLEIHGFQTCPGCGIGIQMVGSYDSVVCRCGCHFCFICKMSFNSGSLWALLRHRYSCPGNGMEAAE